MLNGLHEKGLSMNHKVKVKNYPGGTSETILDNIDDIVKNKPDFLIIHAGTNDLTNGINLLNLEVFCRKGVLRNFAKFTGKHLCQSLFFNKVAGGQAKKL